MGTVKKCVLVSEPRHISYNVKNRCTPLQAAIAKNLYKYEAFIIASEKTLFIKIKEQLNCFYDLNYTLIDKSKINLYLKDGVVFEKIPDQTVLKLRFENRQDVFKLGPHYKDYIWGGTRLKSIFNKNSGYDTVAESWEFSTNPDGKSLIFTDDCGVMELDEFLKLAGYDLLGWKAAYNNRAPVLVKFIDAYKNLSIQVHPDDLYAQKEEKGNGKNEMWYILDCEEGSYIYQGFNKTTTKEEVLCRIRDNTVTDILNKIYVKKGDAFFIKAGTVHAIGKGILVYEVQQNSNCTYRLYDYDRVDSSGKKRELNLEKGLDVLSLNKAVTSKMIGHEKKFSEYVIRPLVSCKYFQTDKYVLFGGLSLDIYDDSFVLLTFTQGGAVVIGSNSVKRCTKGESLLITAGRRKVFLNGKCEFLLTHI